ncbi:hypothetical protein AB0L34_13985 [Micromonospora sp. NPDC052213]|uniref:hypothetical protein n=1 Tax=Micromonospora sp. NPDC052213 TaxID=3155812 RepID=UPI00341D1DDF
MSKPPKFDAFGTMRAVREDDKLTAPQKAVLVFAVLRTNNGDGKVRASLEMIASDAGLSRRTAERALAEDQAEALKYFDRVERSRRRVDLWFKMEPSATESRTRESDRESDSPGQVSPSATQSRTRKPRRESQSEPSATPCPPSATQSRTECDTESHLLPLSTSTSTKRPVGILTRPSQHPADVETFTPTEDEDPWTLAKLTMP